MLLDSVLSGHQSRLQVIFPENNIILSEFFKEEPLRYLIWGRYDEHTQVPRWKVQILVQIDQLIAYLQHQLLKEVQEWQENDFWDHLRLLFLILRDLENSRVQGNPKCRATGGSRGKDKRQLYFLIRPNLMNSEASSNPENNFPWYFYWVSQTHRRNSWDQREYQYFKYLR